MPTSATTRYRSVCGSAFPPRIKSTSIASTISNTTMAQRIGTMRALGVSHRVTAATHQMRKVTNHAPPNPAVPRRKRLPTMKRTAKGRSKRTSRDSCSAKSRGPGLSRTIRWQHSARPRRTGRPNQDKPPQSPQYGNAPERQETDTDEDGNRPSDHGPLPLPSATPMPTHMLVYGQCTTVRTCCQDTISH